jgi:class 3 adenylate cyclase
LTTRIQICGRVIVQVDGRRVDGELPGRQGLLLLVYLAANRDRPVTRDELIEALWPNDLPARPDAALSVLLSKLRSVLGSSSLEGRSQLRLGLSPVVIDLETAAHAVHEAESAIGLRDWPAAWGPARVALHTANRGVLDGFDAPWITDLRARLDDIRLRALTCIAVASLKLGGPELPAAERAARSLVTLSPFRETGYRFLMEALTAQGNTAEALRVYDGVRGLLHDELGTAPSPELQQLHRRLLAEMRGGQEAEPPPGGLPDRTVTIMFADIADSTPLTERVGDTAFRSVARAFETSVRAIVRNAGGACVEGRLLGDGLMAVFPSARQAIECSLDTSAAAAGVGLSLHLGLHAGDVIREEGGNVFGGAVNIAARIAALARPGEVLASETVRTLARTSASVVFDDRGPQALKGVGDAHRLYAIQAPRGRKGSRKAGRASSEQTSPTD